MGKRGDFLRFSQRYSKNDRSQYKILRWDNALSDLLTHCHIVNQGFQLIKQIISGDLFIWLLTSLYMASQELPWLPKLCHVLPKLGNYPFHQKRLLTFQSPSPWTFLKDKVSLRYTCTKISYWDTYTPNHYPFKIGFIQIHTYWNITVLKYVLQWFLVHS